MDDLDKSIEKLEQEWALYHKDHKKYPMPNMMELAKLRSKRDMLRRKDANL